MKRIITSLTFLLSFFFFISFSYSQTTRYVPTDYPIIQDAINASDSGDTVIIEEGNYVQQINFKGKAITVGSRFLVKGDTSHISKTIIDGAFLPQNDSSSLVYFISGEDSNSVLCGLTLQNGRGTYEVVPDWHDIRYGGAIEISKSGATIRKNIIKNCSCISSAWMNSGAAIDCFELPESKTIIIEDNKIVNNEASGGNRAFGGAIECEAISGRLIITKNVIKNNEIGGAQLTGGAGVCILYSNSDNITISNNFINKNTSNSNGTSVAGGIYVVDTKTVEIFNNIISENNCLSSYSFGGGIEIGNWSENPEVKIASANITNNTIVNNSAKREGGGIYLRNINAVIMNNIIRSNDAPTKKQLSFITMQTDPMVTYSNIEGGYEGEGNIDVNPYFCDTTYCILDNDSSKCIDAGNPDPRYNDLILAADDALYPSRGTKRNDMGAFGGPNSKWDKMSIIPSDPATSIENYNFNMPESFELSQNYPNPFNPTTTIKYSLASNVKSETENVKLIVYDVLGKEIITLVNQKQKPGHYKVTWNGLCASGGQVPSGVYFYKLKVSASTGEATNDFIETKKMIFLK